MSLNIFSALFLLMAVEDVKRVIDKTSPKQIGAAIENMLKTGRLVTQSGLDLQQVHKYQHSHSSLPKATTYAR